MRVRGRPVEQFVCRLVDADVDAPLQGHVDSRRPEQEPPRPQKARNGQRVNAPDQKTDVGPTDPDSGKDPLCPKESRVASPGVSRASVERKSDRFGVIDSRIQPVGSKEKKRMDELDGQLE